MIYVIVIIYYDSVGSDGNCVGKPMGFTCFFQWCFLALSLIQFDDFAQTSGRRCFRHGTILDSWTVPLGNCEFLKVVHLRGSTCFSSETSNLVRTNQFTEDFQIITNSGEIHYMPIHCKSGYPPTIDHYNGKFPILQLSLRDSEKFRPMISPKKIRLRCRPPLDPV